MFSILYLVFPHTGRRNQEFKAVPKWRKYWRAIQKKDKPELLEKLTWERRYLQRLMIKFMRILETIPETEDINVETVRLVSTRLFQKGRCYETFKNSGQIFCILYSFLFSNLLSKFLKLHIPDISCSNNKLLFRYCERFLELMIDLEALLPTRRFFNTVMDDCHMVVRCQLAPLVRRPEGQLFSQVSVPFLVKVG